MEQLDLFKTTHAATPPRPRPGRPARPRPAPKPANCKECGRDYHRRHGNQAYCSDDCRLASWGRMEKQAKARYAERRPRAPRANTCRVCGKPCVRVYCSRKCLDQRPRRHPTEEAHCEECGKPFTRVRYHTPARYCSSGCRSAERRRVQASRQAELEQEREQRRRDVATRKAERETARAAERDRIRATHPRRNGTRVHSGALGTAAELQLIARLLERGHNVAVPVVDNDGVDVIVDYGIKVQVKSARTRDERGRASAANARHGVLRSHVDILSLYLADSDMWWHIPREVAGETRGLHVRVDGSGRYSRWFEAWHVFDKP